MIESSAKKEKLYDGSRLLLDLLQDQSRLTAVEEFSSRHDRHEIEGSRYRDLLPVRPPTPGEQFAFEVDLDKCSGCKACVTACHSLNGLDEGEAWRETGALVSTDWRSPFQQVVTTACHHCLEPGCLEGCPVLAYEKSPLTGVVRHLDDQCIGCQYCVLMCPYQVPKYSSQRGIVRKCDMCSQRLAANEAPACAQACPNEAIKITIVSQEKIKSSVTVGSFLPGAPDPRITFPTTRYISQWPLSQDLVPADAAQHKAQPAHLPLVWMLVLTQAGAGAFLFLPFTPAPGQITLAVLGLLSTLLGISGSALHLGQPRKAWRCFLGLRTSWLSREIIAFSLFAFLAVLTTITIRLKEPGVLKDLLLWSTAAVGLLAVFCSAMIYHTTRRVLWSGRYSIPNFLGSAVLLGAGAAWVSSIDQEWFGLAWGAVMIPAGILKLGLEHRLLRYGELPIGDEVWGGDEGFMNWSLARSARFMTEHLPLLTRVRFFSRIAGGILLPSFLLLLPSGTWIPPFLALVFCLLAEFAERYTFFIAVVPPKMPGNG